MSLLRRGRPVEPEPVSDAGDPPHGPRAGRQLTRLVVARQRARIHVNPHLLVVPGCLTRPTGDLDSQLSPRKRPRRSLSSPWYVELNGREGAHLHQPWSTVKDGFAL